MPGAERQFDAAQAALDTHIRVLSGDDYGGRQPGTEGGRKTEQYLVDALQSYGYAPGAGDGEWRQPVELVRYSPAEAKVTLMSGDETRIVEGDLLVVSGPPQDLLDLPVERIAADEAVREGALSGKAALLDAADARGLFAEVNGGAPDAIVLQAATSEEFEQFSRFVSGGRWQLNDDEEAQPPIAVLSPEFAAFTAPGESPLSISVESRPSIQSVETANVIGRLAGNVPGSGAVLVLAHWDHLGECGSEGDEDRLCNGAVDNASGIGVMLETARRIALQGGLDRDLYIVGTTAEEIGLLGAEAFARDPPLPLPTIVAAFNIDTVAIAPRGASTTVVGWGRTPLDEDIRVVVEGLDRKFKVDEYTEQFVRRQDGWALLSRDVPAVLVSTSFGDAKAFGAFLSGAYHGPNDEWREDLELGGATDDIFTHIALLQHFGSVQKYQPGERTEGAPAADNGDE
ncbi:hypothetical protein ELI_07100 [Erythrobacter litoralis HTCC2594]|uniref:Peptidase M28 domain-containing protein n=2 Tax=Erythrobacter litoralis TaxID=39960 RepID=Q2N9X9_ERYLH|nr:hypothetical protein ELI_07100 [Erythrobacter litoralis HTCC2594]